MPVRLRKLIGMMLFFAGLIFYAVIIMEFGARVVPNTPWIELPFYLAAGIAWIFPMMPLFRWMETGQWRKPAPQEGP